MHSWGDDWKGWEDLGKAQDEIYFWGNRLGRIGGQLKEKYGEIRWYVHLNAPHDLHDIVKHGHAAFRWTPSRHPFLCFINNLSKAYIYPVRYLFYKYRVFMYGFAYHRACKKYPGLRKEILMCSDAKQLLFKSEIKFLEGMVSDEGQEV
jgi:hypothetical protein